jgi:phosphomannomutase
MKLMTLKISISGVRGTVPDSLTPEVCLSFGKAFGTYLEGGKAVLGSDSRPSSEYIRGIFFSALLSCGCQVIDLGICPTPTVGIMVRQLRAKGGVVITASHNPLPWNGFKFMRSDGIFLNEKQARKLLKLESLKQFKRGAAKGVMVDPQAIDIHINRVLKNINAPLIRAKNFRVAVDACNSAGSVALVKLLQKLGCQVLPLHCDTTLPFPRNPEPTPESLRELCALVKSKQAAIGFALDSDADRLAMVTEKGEPAGEELTLALAVKYLLSSKTLLGAKRIVVANLSTSRVLDDICQQHGATIIRTKVGEVHVAEKIKKVNALIGGEGNGGVIFPPVGYNRDSLSGAALILSYLAAAGKSVSALIDELPHYEIIKSKIECHDLNEAQSFIEKTKKKFNPEEMILTEGIKVNLPDAWVHIRPSNTEPIIRIIAEGKTRKAAEELVNKVRD